MQRNLDLIRDMLLRIESNENPVMYCHDFVTEDISHDVVTYHLNLLLDSMYINASCRGAVNSPTQYTIKGLTTRGHDYLDSVRDDTLWSNLKKKLGSSIASLPLSVVPDIAISYLKSMLGI